MVNVGMKMSYIQGPMYFANGNFKLIPRNAADADFSNIDTIKPYDEFRLRYGAQLLG
jgi:hypothetical protein